MVDAKSLSGDAGSTRLTPKAEPTQEDAQKRSELQAFRDAGVLTDAELDEQMAKLRWGIP